MFRTRFLSLSRLTRRRPWSGLLALLCLAPLVSCANEPYLAQNAAPPNAAYGQQNYAAPTSGQFLAPPQLGELIARIALYPDDLIGIILPASTYPLQIVQASRYLDAVRTNSTLSPDDSWDNAVVALLNYPDVVDMMNRELAWTERLGQAVIMQQGDVITAIGQFRAQVQAAGNLRSDERQIVEYEQGAIRIRPANPQIIYVPQYEPTRVIVYSSEPAFGYYPRPCPVYYYNYTGGYPSGFSNFWGVSTMFTIGWSNSRLRMHDYDYYDDPRFDHPYNGYFYRRSHHDWDDDDPTWGGDDDDHGDGRGHHGRGERPREHDWQPRPTAVGGRPRHDQGDDGGRFIPPPAVALPSPTHTIRSGSTPAVEPPGDESSVRRRPRAVLVPAPTETRDLERPRNFAPGDEEGGVRRRVTVVPNQGLDQDQRIERGRSYSPSPALESPGASVPMNVRRRDSFPSERREFAPMPSAPSSRMSMPTPQRREREPSVQPGYSSSLPAPTRSMRNMDDGRSSAGMAPSRPEPRMAPSRPESRMAPSRTESRAPVASSRSGDLPTPSRRGSDEDRARGSRDR